MYLQVILKSKSKANYLSMRTQFTFRIDTLLQTWLFILHYPVDSVVCFVNTYPLDSVIQASNNLGKVFVLEILSAR